MFWWGDSGRASLIPSQGEGKGCAKKILSRAAVSKSGEEKGGGRGKKYDLFFIVSCGFDSRRLVRKKEKRKR